MYGEHCPLEATSLRRKGKVKETEQKAEATEERGKERGDEGLVLLEDHGQEMTGRTFP